MKTTFDPGKRAWTLENRGLDFAVDAEKVFSGDTVTMIDDRFDYREVRQISAGFLGDRMVVIVWTQRGTSRHIISMRYCHGKEEKRWRQILRQGPDR
jgi:uncharacterized DUF497 family protein